MSDLTICIIGITVGLILVPIVSDIYECVKKYIMTNILDATFTVRSMYHKIHDAHVAKLIQEGKVTFDLDTGRLVKINKCRFNKSDKLTSNSITESCV